MAVGVCTHFAWEMKILHYWMGREGRAKNFSCMCEEYFSDMYESAVFREINLIVGKFIEEKDVRSFKLEQS